MNNSTVLFNHYEESTPVPFAFKAALLAITALIALVSIIGNILVIITFVKTQSLRTSTNYYITSMAVTDLLFVATNLPLYISSRLSVFGHSVTSFHCKIGVYLNLVSYSVSIANLVLITVDRFIAILHPMKVIMITRRVRSVFISLTWVLPMGFFAPITYISTTTEKPDEVFLCGSENWGFILTIYSIIGFVLLYCAPLIVIIILNTRIMTSLKRTNPAIQGIGHSNVRRKQNQRIMKMLLLITITFVGCWTLFHTTMFLHILSQNVLKRSVREMVHISCFYFLPFVSTAVSPLILFTFSTIYRQGLKNCLCLAVSKCRSCIFREEVVREENVELPELHAVTFREKA